VQLLRVRFVKALGISAVPDFIMLQFVIGGRETSRYAVRVDLHAVAACRMRGCQLLIATCSRLWKRKAVWIGVGEDLFRARWRA
jgi:hypothetical protein